MLYNFREQATRMGHKNPGGVIAVNYVGNVIKTGADALPGVTYFPLDAVSPPPRSTFAIWFDGNAGLGQVTLDVPPSYVDNEWMVPARLPAPQVTTTTAQQAFFDVLSGAGATLPERDAVDQRIAFETQSGTGVGICHPDDVGGWPLLTSAPFPPDDDGDGMPSAWEAAQGFDPLDPADGRRDAEGDGYTNVEEYLNDTSPHAPD